MGTITARPRKGGGIGYTAQIGIKREGTVVYQESQTFDRKRALGVMAHRARLGDAAGDEPVLTIRLDQLWNVYRR